MMFSSLCVSSEFLSRRCLHVCLFMSGSLDLGGGGEPAPGPSRPLPEPWRRMARSPEGSRLYGQKKTTWSHPVKHKPAKLNHRCQRSFKPLKKYQPNISTSYDLLLIASLDMIKCHDVMRSSVDLDNQYDLP